VQTNASRVLRPRPWLRATIIFAASLFLLGAVSSYLRSGWTWMLMAYVVVSVVGLAGVLEVAVTRIVLSETALESHSLFYRRAYQAADIASVTWEAGVGVSVKLVSGGWARIPEMGYNSQGLANTLRAWLKRAKSSAPA
jgi:hypothetical protein